MYRISEKKLEKVCSIIEFMPKFISEGWSLSMSASKAAKLAGYENVSSYDYYHLHKMPEYQNIKKIYLTKRGKNVSDFKN